MRTHALGLFFCATLPGLAAEGDPGTLKTNEFRVDTSNRATVRRFFNAVYYSGAGIRSEWNGDVAQCRPGTTSIDYQEAVRTRINFFRAMAGVPAEVQFDPEFSAKAQQAALIVSANSSISHFPTEDFSCRTEEGAVAAAVSNLALGTSGIDSIEAYMLDAGDNYRVGHRRWLLYPQTRLMGNGDIDPPDGSTARRANANWVIDNDLWAPRPETRDGFVAWPPRGYVPYKIVYPRWSFSFPGADFTEATVTVTTNGVPLPVHIENLETGYGENTIVFVPGAISPAARVMAEKTDYDVTYRVAILGVLLDGVSTNFSYSVTLFDPDQEESAPIVLSGPAEPELGRSNRFIVGAVEEASGYDFRFGTLAPFRRVDAEGPPSDVSAQISALYSLVQTNIYASSNAAFHLAHTTPARPQILRLSRLIVPSERSELRYHSRLAAAATGQVARVQVSLDEGSSWRDLYTQTGDNRSGEMGFTLRRIPLAQFAGRAIQVRFEYGLSFGEPMYAPGAGDHIGWYIDDIMVTSAQELTVEGQASSLKPEFPFRPPGEKTYYLDARPRFFDGFKGEWAAGQLVNPVAQTQSPAEVRVVAIRPDASGMEVEFEPTNTSTTAIHRLESAETPSGPWQIEPVEEQAGSTGRKFRVSGEAARARFFRVTIE